MPMERIFRATWLSDSWNAKKTLGSPRAHAASRKWAGENRRRVDDLAQVHALPDLVRVLLDARPDPEHGRMLHGARGDPALLRGNGDRDVVLRHREADAVRREDPPVHARLPAAGTPLASGRHVRRDDAAVRRDGGLDRRVLLGREPAHVNLRVVEDEAGPRGLLVGR